MACHPYAQHWTAVGIKQGCSFGQPVQIESVRHAGLDDYSFLTWRLSVVQL